jgi:hypothetical protein
LFSPRRSSPTQQYVSFGPAIEAALLLSFSTHEMDYTGGVGDPKPLEIIGKLLDLITPNDTTTVQVSGGRVKIVGTHFKPRFRLTQPVDLVEPKILVAEFEHDVRRIIQEPRKPQNIGIEPNRSVVFMRWNLYGDVSTCGELRFHLFPKPQ